MADQKVELQCEMCGNEFEILVRNYEKVVQEDQPILCTECFENIIAEHDKADIPERKKFEYLIVPLSDYENKLGLETMAFTAYGQDGWELIQIANNKAYFKREYVKGLK